jgi:hypothetical protein
MIVHWNSFEDHGCTSGLLFDRQYPCWNSGRHLQCSPLTVPQRSWFPGRSATWWRWNERLDVRCHSQCPCVIFMLNLCFGKHNSRVEVFLTHLCGSFSCVAYEKLSLISWLHKESNCWDCNLHNPVCQSARVPQPLSTPMVPEYIFWRHLWNTKKIFRAPYTILH